MEYKICDLCGKELKGESLEKTNKLTVLSEGGLLYLALRLCWECCHEQLKAFTKKQTLTEINFRQRVYEDD